MNGLMLNAFLSKNAESGFMEHKDRPSLVEFTSHGGSSIHCMNERDEGDVSPC
jgi:hypothetical protein